MENERYIRGNCKKTERKVGTIKGADTCKDRRERSVHWFDNDERTNEDREGENGRGGRVWWPPRQLESVAPWAWTSHKQKAKVDARVKKQGKRASRVDDKNRDRATLGRGRGEEIERRAESERRREPGAWSVEGCVHRAVTPEPLPWRHAFAHARMRCHGCTTIASRAPVAFTTLSPSPLLQSLHHLFWLLKPPLSPPFTPLLPYWTRYCLSSLCFLVFFPVVVSAIIIIIIIAISHHHYW